MDYNISKVVNLTTLTETTYINSYDLETNLISNIIYSKGDSARILDLDYREQITKESDARYVRSENGQLKVYSPTFNMVSYYTLLSNTDED